MGKTAKRALAIARVQAGLLKSLAESVDKLNETVTLMGESIDDLNARVDALEAKATPTPSVDHTDAPDGYYAVASNGECEGCAFYLSGDCSIVDDSAFSCCAPHRKDNRDVIFRRIEGGGGDAPDPEETHGNFDTIDHLKRDCRLMARHIEKMEKDGVQPDSGYYRRLGEMVDMGCYTEAHKLARELEVGK